MLTLADLTEWRVTFTMAAGNTRRTFVVTIPAASEEHAREGAYGLAYAINDSTGHAWKMTNDLAVEKAVG